MRPRCSILTGGFDFSGCGDCTSCPPFKQAEMSNSEPSAIVLQGIPCMCGLYKFRFEWRTRFAQGSPPFTFSRSPSLRALLENPSEGGTDACEDDQPANGCNRARHDAAGVHRYVEEQDVKDDGTDQRECQRNVAVTEKKESANKLEEENGHHKVRGDQYGEELRGQRGQGGRRDEVEEAVQAEDGEYQAHQIAGDDRGDFHRVLLVYAHCLVGDI